AVPTPEARRRLLRDADRPAHRCPLLRPPARASGLARGGAGERGGPRVFLARLREMAAGRRARGSGIRRARAVLGPAALPRRATRARAGRRQSMKSSRDRLFLAPHWH